MTFMWRRYTPNTNRFSLARIFISHGPLDGNRSGIDGVWPVQDFGARSAVGEGAR